MTYRCILADPPWQQGVSGAYATPKNKRPSALPYETMSLDAIKALPVRALSDPEGSMLFLWTTNSFLREGFDVMSAWGFRYLAPVHWEKPSGIGNWFVHRTQTLLVGYTKPLRMAVRYRPNVVKASAPRHSQKPDEAYRLIEEVSFGPRIELFARNPRDGWRSLGNEVTGRSITEDLEDI